MTFRLSTRLLCAAAFSTLSALASASEQLPTEAFARHPLLLSPRLSPDGQYFSVRMDDRSGEYHSLAIYRVADMSKPVQLLKLPKYELPVDVRWVGANRLVFTKGKLFGSLDEPLSTGEVFATDADGKHQDYLYGFQSIGRRAATHGGDNGYAYIAGLPDKANGHVFLKVQSWNNENLSSVYDVDAKSGARKLIGDINVGGMSFMIAGDGTAHFAFGTNNDFNYVVYRRVSDSWALQPSSQIGETFVPLHQAPDGKQVYALYSQSTGPYSLVQQNEDGSGRRVLAADGDGNISGSLLQWSAPPLRPFAATPATGKPRLTYFDPSLPEAKLHMALSKNFPNGFVDFINFSEDGSQLLFEVSSDRDPGTFYLMDVRQLKVRKLFSSEDWIDPAQMAERRPIHFKASDGLEIEGFLTLPPGRNEANLPMVLVPHGGPHGVQDTWFYDRDAQFLANRGYLVLQVNYRGSGGRGDAFEQDGYLKWGTRIQQDLIDGVKWAIHENYADPHRVCVYGASFGGYSAMMTTIRAPGLFKCAIGYAGVYDLGMMYKKGDVKEARAGRSYLNSVIGKNDVELEANSPDKLADQINVPVLLVHGEDDNRAPFSQAKAMRAALDAARKPYEWLSKPGEGHGFYKEDNEIDFYNTLQAFLEKHIGKGA